MDFDKLSLEEFIKLPNVIDITLRYSEWLEEFSGYTPYIKLGKILSGNIVIAYVEENYISELLKVLGSSRIDIFPIVLGLMGKESLESAGITGVQRQPFLDLRGQGTLIGFIDTGIDYMNDSFKNEDGTSKIDFIWDQTIEGKSPNGYYFGTEYTNSDINTALKTEQPYNVVPSKDIHGHGTFLASVAASKETKDYIGAAPDASIIVVKLKKASKYYIEKYLVPEEQENVYESTSIMLGIDYMIRKSIALMKPLSICIGLGTNIGGHDSYTILEEYLRTVSNQGAICICTAAGNESNAKHHTNGIILNEKSSENIEIKVSEKSKSFPIYLWNTSADRLSVSIKSPTGEVVNRMPAKSGTIIESQLILENSTVIIEYTFPVEASGSQVTTIKILDPTPGIWTITVYGDIIVSGEYNAWLPITGFLSSSIEFLTPTPNYTVTVPATTIGSITCGAYNDKTNSLYFNSSWGPNRLSLLAPELVAPGVDVSGIYPTGIGNMTGTSVATAITAGAAALMLQWGYIKGNDVSLNTYRIRAYLIRGCIRDKNIEYPSVQWGYGKLNLVNTFNQIRITFDI